MLGHRKPAVRVVSNRSLVDKPVLDLLFKSARLLFNPLSPVTFSIFIKSLKIKAKTPRTLRACYWKSRYLVHLQSVRSLVGFRA